MAAIVGVMRNICAETVADPEGGDEGDASPPPARHIGSLFHVKSQNVILCYCRVEIDDENRLLISGLTTNSFRVGSLGCIYDVAFPPPRFNSSSSRRRRYC